MKQGIVQLVMATAIGAAATMSGAADDENVLVIEVAGATTGTVEVELLPEHAPNHVSRIKYLASGGQYDNVVFHRVIEGFMAQTGDVKFGVRGGNDGSLAGRGGSAEPNLEAEFSNVPYTRGVVGMARAAHPDSANSQFFIMFADAPHLNGQYTVFGRIISGMDVVDQIKKGNTAKGGAVSDPDYMSQVYIKSSGPRR